MYISESEDKGKISEGGKYVRHQRQVPAEDRKLLLAKGAQEQRQKQGHCVKWRTTRCGHDGACTGWKRLDAWDQRLRRVQETKLPLCSYVSSVMCKKWQETLL